MSFDYEQHLKKTTKNKSSQIKNNNKNSNNSNNNNSTNSSLLGKRKQSYNAIQYKDEEDINETVKNHHNQREIQFANHTSYQDQESLEQEHNTKSQLNYLWSLSHYSQPGNPNLGRYFMYKFREMANVEHMRGIPPMVESKNCRSCGQFLIPSVNCRVRVVSKSDLSNKSKSMITTVSQEINSLQYKTKKAQNFKHVNAVVKTCLFCSNLTPIRAELKEKKLERKANVKKFKASLSNNTNTTNTTTTTTNNSTTSPTLASSPTTTSPTLQSSNKNNNPSNKNKSNNNSTSTSTSNSNNSSNNKKQVAKAGSKNIKTKDDSLKDFLSNMGSLMK
ncbi:hypothetical protein CYY_006749 [Polysphondylium violaceum]|uniref:Uncharacterized protein n=1 Tax=Polysphondylium violaceum TaxID=133409 RepID=A0A8J4PQJ1_9MYCE|nr:hypothetical protein CYY_006749 [Polysphondylium violaceum]